MTSHRSPAVDAYLAKARPFAQPILSHLREVVHRAAPEVEEQIKWSMPFFVVKGVIIANMAAHKEHCSFGLWGQEAVASLREAGLGEGGNMGSFGRILSLEDLPPEPQLLALLEDAVGLVRDGKRKQSIQRVAKPARKAEVEVPSALAEALGQNKAAAARFATMSESCRREYADWIADAKRDETRARRVATAMEWIAEGKGRNWKYEKAQAAVS